MSSTHPYQQLPGLILDPHIHIPTNFSERPPFVDIGVSLTIRGESAATIWVVATVLETGEAEPSVMQECVQATIGGGDTPSLNLVCVSSCVNQYHAHSIGNENVRMWRESTTMGCARAFFLPRAKKKRSLAQPLIPCFLHLKLFRQISPPLSLPMKCSTPGPYTVTTARRQTQRWPLPYPPAPLRCPSVSLRCG